MERNNQQMISQTFTELDTEFDQHLANMKKYVLELQDKKARQLCALWIKKLCESTGSSLLIRQIRNSYSLKLLECLQNYEPLISPFNEKPPNGSLKPFNSSSLPEWVDEVEDSTNNNPGSSNYNINDNIVYNNNNNNNNNNNQIDDKQSENLKQRRFTFNETTKHNLPTSSRIENNISHHRHISPPPNYPQMTTIPPYQSSTKILNTPSFNYDDHNLPSHRETRRSTSYHNLSDYVEDEYENNNNILNHNNNKLLSGKVFPTISNEYLDSNNDSYDYKNININSTTNNTPAQLLLAQQKQRLNSIQIDDDRKYRQLQNDIDLQFRKIEAKFQEEKLTLQQKHDTAVQKILDRKNTEIEELKSHFRKKSKEYEETIHKLERITQTYIKDITNTKENHEKQLVSNKKISEEALEKKQNDYEKKFAELMSKCEQEKFDLQKQHTKVFQDLVDETNNRLKKVEDEHHEQQKAMDNVVCELEKRIQILKNEIEKNVETKNQLNDEKLHLQANIETLVQKIRDAESKQRNLESDIIQLKEFHEQELKTNRAKFDAHVVSIKEEHEITKQKLSQLKEETEKAKLQFENTIEKLELFLREKEGQLANANEINKQQKLQAEKALAELKRQIEINSNKLYDDMKDQMTKVESDLQRSKSLREKQAKDFQKQFDEIQNDHRYKIDNLKNEFENEKLKFKRQFENEKQALKKEHSDACNEMQEQFQSQIIEKNEQHRIKMEKLASTINDLEKQILQLKEELIESNTLRKQQIVELGILREDEKQKLMREHELQLSRLKMEFDETQQKCKHFFEQQLEDQDDKANSQLKLLEKDFNERTNKQNGILQDLQKTIQELKDENKRLKDHYEQELHDTMMKFEDERNALKKHYNTCNWQLEQDLDALKNRKDSLEKKLKQLKNEHENELTAFKLHYEEKMRGLLPLDMRRDLEETILALKSQIQSLQQRNLLFQAELDERGNRGVNHQQNSPYHTTSVN